MNNELINRLRQNRYNTWNDNLGPEPDKAQAAYQIEQLITALERQSSWIRAALDCADWKWDADQREVAEVEYAEAINAIINVKYV